MEPLAQKMSTENEISGNTIKATYIEPEMFSRSKHKTKTIKLLEENLDKTLSDINHSTILYDPPPRI